MAVQWDLAGHDGQETEVGAVSAIQRACSQAQKAPSAAPSQEDPVMLEVIQPARSQRQREHPWGDDTVGRGGA